MFQQPQMFPQPMMQGLPMGQPGCSCQPMFQQPICQPPVVQAPPPVIYRPQVETQYRMQPTMTYQDVPRVQYRREAYMQQVPVTTYRQVLVPQTVMQPQTRFRDVAYQTTERVPRMVNQVVPMQTVRMVPEMAPCGPCGGGAPMMGAYPGMQPMLGAYPNAYPGQQPMTAYGQFSDPGIMTATAPQDYGLGTQMLPPSVYGGQRENPPYNPGVRVPVPPGADAGLPTQTGSNGADWPTIQQRTSSEQQNPGVSSYFGRAPSAALITQSRLGLTR